MEKKDKINIHQIFWYFVIFSIIGLLIETIHCYLTTGTLESRKGLIWGPFCPVYGVSATILLIALNKHQKKNVFWIFMYGFLIGSVAEYILSYMLEAIYGIRFWNYEPFKWDLNGRICLQYSFYWGVLSVLLIKLVKSIIDRMIDKVNTKIRNRIEIILFVFFIVNCIATVWGIQTYQNRVIYNKSYEAKNNIFSNIRYQIEENYFTNDRMSKTFPNLRFEDENGNEVWIKTLIKE